MKIETRTTRDVTATGRRIVGYAAVFDSPSRDLGGFTERVAHGAFDDVLAAPDLDVHAVVNHDANAVIGRTKSGTLRLAADTHGLRFEVDLPDSPLGQNVRAAVGRGDIDGASFKFRVADGGETWNGNERTLTRIAELIDVTVATRGAYPAAQVELRTQKAEEAVAMIDDVVVSEATDEPVTVTDNDVVVEQRNTAEPQPVTTAGTLRVEDRTVTTNPPVGDRFRDAMLTVNAGEARALTTASTLSPGELGTFLFDRMRSSSVALASGVQVITTDRDSVVFPRLTADVAPGWYAEAGTITAGDPTLDSITATPRKLAHRVIFSNEVIEDSEPSALDVVTRNMVASLGLKLDLGVFEGSGTAPEVRGLKNVAGINTVSMGTNGAAITSLDPFADAIKLLEDANAAPGAIVMGSRTWAAVRKLKDTQNRYLVSSGSSDAPRSIFGVPVFISTQLSIAETQGTANNAASAYVYDPSQVYLVRRSDVVVELDRSRLFDSDQSELRGKLRADLIAPNPTAITRIAGIIP